LTLERELHARKTEGWTLNNLGNLYLTLGDYAQAEAYFMEALALRRGANLPHYVAEDLAGLTRLALAQGNLTGAMTWIEELWPILEENPALEGAEHALQALVACYQVLRANADARAVPLLTTLHTQLQEHAAKITDADLRRSFLENVPEHHLIVTEFIKLQTGTLSPPPAPPATAEPAAVQPPSAEPVAPSPTAESVTEPVVEPPPAESAAEPTAPEEPLPPEPEPPLTASVSKPLIARIPLEGAEGAASIVIVIENLNINFQGAPGIVVESDLADLLQQLLKKKGV
jgi:hypothetical protein